MASMPKSVATTLSASSDVFGSPDLQLPAGFHNSGNLTVPGTWRSPHFDCDVYERDHFLSGSYRLASKEKAAAPSAIGDRSKEDFPNNCITPYAERNFPSCFNFDYGWDQESLNSLSTAARSGLPLKSYMQYDNTNSPFASINTLPDSKKEVFEGNGYHSRCDLDEPKGFGNFCWGLKSAFVPFEYNFNHRDDNVSTKAYQLFPEKNLHITNLEKHMLATTKQDIFEETRAKVTENQSTRKHEELYKEMKQKHEELCFKMNQIFTSFGTYVPQMELRMEDLSSQLRDVKEELCELNKSAPNLGNAAEPKEKEESLQNSDSSDSEWEFI
ncbi:hypothetical protein HPP92_025581 [Vanilla planifolia]|uniref:Uncharacterized protein n=1 Tax=Vanilla planifolia TaxID=51239 RepID=A0A835PMK6_VANPL|nr:hypothetical protein HPP92_025581 [Vanilla planifolia]